MYRVAGYSATDDDNDDDDSWDDFWNYVGDWFGLGGGSGHGGSGNHGVSSPGPTGGIPSLTASGTTQPGSGPASIWMALYYNGSTGVSTGSWPSSTMGLDSIRTG
jgi:hypothetical protein